MVVEALPRQRVRLPRQRPLPAGAVAGSEQFPRPTTPAGWAEIRLGLWWLLVAAAVTLFSALFWALVWPEPRGLAALRVHLEFAVPLALAWAGGVVALLTGLVGVLRQHLRLRAPARQPRRPAAPLRGGALP
jgi:hypothetical protein